MVLDYLLLDSAALPRHLASLNYFLLSKKVEGRSPATIEWLSQSLNDLYRFLESKGLTPLPEEIQPIHIRAWLAHLQDRGLSKKLQETPAGRWEQMGKLTKNGAACIMLPLSICPKTTEALQGFEPTNVVIEH